VVESRRLSIITPSRSTTLCSITTNSRYRPGPRLVLVVVCVLHAVSALILVGPHEGLGWDETVYLSQLNAHVPAGLFSAPRARGVTFIVAPVTLITTSTVVLRVYLSALAGVGAYLGFRPWQRLRPGYVVPAAALMFSSLWMTVFYAFEAMPNEYVAYAVLAVTAYAICFLQRPDRRRSLGYVAIWMTALALIRPSDAGYFTIGLGLLLLVCRLGRVRARIAVLAAAFAGLAIGVGEWVIEAFVSYGGPLARYRAASRENGGGLHLLAIDKQFQALAGPLLCRRACVADAPAIARVWWVVGVLLVVAGCGYGWRRRQTTTVLPAIVAVVITLQYLVFIGYAAPRFLIPTYALLSLPAAEAAAAFWSARALVVRNGARVLLPLGFVLLGAIQVDVLRGHVLPGVHAQARHVVALDHVLTEVGVRPPCLVVGVDAAQVSYALRCADSPLGDRRVQAKAATGEPVAVVSPGRAPPDEFYARWRHREVAGITPGSRLFVYVTNADPSTG
jgi:hypothetical protein